MNLQPRGIIAPESVFRPMILKPLPKLTSVPARLATPPITFEQDIRDPYQESAVAEVMDKLKAEHERMGRLLPPAPRGWKWEIEVQTMEPMYNFTMNTADVHIRMVYRLKEI